jgi:hypothetical protein
MAAGRWTATLHPELGAILIDSKRGPFVEVTVEAI